MLQLNPPLIRIVVGGKNWAGPTGAGVANFIEPGHRDDDIIWIIDMDETGQTWCVPNRYVRAPANITYGRKSDNGTELDNAPGKRSADQPANGRSHVHLTIPR